MMAIKELAYLINLLKIKDTELEDNKRDYTIKKLEESIKLLEQMGACTDQRIIRVYIILKALLFLHSQ
jgi:hypothetical protein